ncbi:hypothetical protein HANVADRAFT_51943 [Hanseniaspora valbyensis NRRL Y-1626]|uniref:Glycosyl transferase family 3 domain-containing protein n=1 Tax=Hanseniaspora valbyensis NRRL Y-1626 TaxID=766949 RepID=A0A1B7TGK9_9ASCO|nr:hypothetical protein HANVADRAFT_51943 [Hanseniaspora valbyensis NRRL Y-1626]
MDENFTVLYEKFESIISNNTKLLLKYSNDKDSNCFNSDNLYDTLITTFDIIELFDKNLVTDANKHFLNKITVLFGSFLTGLTFSKLHLKAEYISAACKAILSRSTTISKEEFSLQKPYLNKDLKFVDIVGTGGDGQNTFNVSTSSAIVMSGYKNCKIIKHGGKASTSNSGSGDMINKLGITTSKVDKNFILKNKDLLLEKEEDGCNFLFLLAPQFHYAMKLVAPIRAILKIPTIFNIVGPLLHPMGGLINCRVLGVYDRSLGLEYCKAASLMFPECHTLVVNGLIGLDELSPVGESKIWEYNPERQNIDEYVVSPADFGLKEHSLEECKSMSPELNAKYLYDNILSKKTFNIGDEEPIYDYILLNSALLYCLINNSKNYKKAVVEVDNIIKSGNSLINMNKFINTINKE